MAKKTGRLRVKRVADEIVLTPAERVLLWRRRKGWNQQQAAKHWGVSFHTYKLIEYGEIESKTMGLSRHDSMSPHERCFIYRKRCDKTQEEVALELKVCRYWLRKMENGHADPTALLSYWES